MRSVIAIFLAAAAPLLAGGNSELIPIDEEMAAVKRTLLALYDGITIEDTSRTPIYRFAEKPLNHLGIKLKYCDIHKGLPDLDDSEDLLGVITWFKSEHVGIDPRISLEWCKKALKKGLKFFVIGEAIFQLDKEGELSLAERNSFWNLLGIEEGQWISATYFSRAIDLDPDMMNFERDATVIEEPYRIMKAASSSALPHATARYKNSRFLDSHLIITTPNGGYANAQYALFSFLSEVAGINYYWKVNPFELFRQAFDCDSIPKVDITTEAGRRIYYSHIDGDGWNNGPQLTRYNKSDQPKISAETVYREVIAPFPDLPVSCGPIGADLALDWVGTKESRRIAKMIFSLPQVEIASHTMSHPFDWYFFEDYLPQDEIKYLHHYPHDGWAGNQRYEDTYKKAVQNIRKKELKEGYEMARGFADHPFDLDLEIQGSLDEINATAPEGKKVKILLWSGDCKPFKKALEASYQAGVKNMNGGDARFDYVFSSYVWTPPIGRWVEEKLQVHASSSNENTYTNLWQGKYWAFANVPITYINSEYPIRTLPMNLYYHIYCAENEPALSALLNNVKFAQKQKICPLFASSYAEIAEGFYSTRIVRLSPSKWEFSNRKGANTIRFDRAALHAVDFKNSVGVIGQKHYQGSLYVALDRKVEKAQIALKKSLSIEREPLEKEAYLVESRWRVWGVQCDGKGGVAFNARGFGKGEMIWSVGSEGEYVVEVEDGGNRSERRLSSVERLLPLELQESDNREVKVQLRPV